MPSALQLTTKTKSMPAPGKTWPAGHEYSFDSGLYARLPPAGAEGGDAGQGRTKHSSLGYLVAYR